MMFKNLSRNLFLTLGLSALLTLFASRYGISRIESVMQEQVLVLFIIGTLFCLAVGAILGRLNLILAALERLSPAPVKTAATPVASTRVPAATPATVPVAAKAPATKKPAASRVKKA
jgi:hypothetical protein